MFRIIALYFFVAWLFSWWPFFDPLFSKSSLPIEEYENVDLNEYFYFADGFKQYLGRVRGANSCGNKADSFASSQNARSDWSYI
jgi:hypothetical protein